MADVTAWEAAVDAFVASPSVANQRAMEGEYVKLPRGVSGDGASVTFSSLGELTAWAVAKLAQAAATRDTKRVITARTSYGGLQ
jgi:hypothetical protein